MATIIRGPLFSNTADRLRRTKRVATVVAIGFAVQGSPALLSEAPPAQDPFRQNHWPNPIVKQQSYGSVSYKRGVTVTVIDPFKQTDWQNPRIAGRAHTGATDHFRPDKLAPADPTRQLEWPNPTRLRSIGGALQVARDVTVTVIDPFRQTDFKNPVTVRRAHTGETGYFGPDKLAVEDPFVPVAWPNPLRPQGVGAHVDVARDVTVTVIDPFRQSQWPNPLRPGPRQGHTQGFGPSQLEPVGDPNKQLDWPNPLRVVGKQGYVQGLGAEALLPPFAQHAWPNPLRDGPRQSHLQGQNPDSIPPQPPVKPFDWPNPTLKKRTQLGYEHSSNLVLGIALEAPRRPFDWQNPLRPIRTQLGYTHSAPDLDAIPPQPPFKPLEWANPQRARYAQPQFAWPVPETLLPVAAVEDPFRLRDWPNPIRPTRLGGSTSLKRGVTVTVIDPFRQSDWVNPRGARHPQQAFTINLRPLLAEPAPFYQNEWPLPLRAYGIGGALQISRDVTVTVIDPFRQSEWPNPLRPLPRQGYTQGLGPEAFVPAGDPFYQTDWPNPRVPGPVGAHVDVARDVTVTVIDPFKQTEWPNPAIRRAPVPDPGSSAITLLSLPVEDPRRQLEWPNPLRAVTKPGYTQGLGAQDIPPPPAVDPRKQLDWPNPLRARNYGIYQAGTDRPAPDAILPVGRLLDWPNPLRDRRNVAYNIKNVRKPPTLPVPFAQADWPLPVRARATTGGIAHNLTINIPPIVNPEYPAVEFPNPRGIRGQTPEVTPNLLTTTLAVQVEPPFAQLEWIVPLRRIFTPQPKSFRPEPVAPPQITPFDWPNPRIKPYPIANRTWTISLLQTTLFVAPEDPRRQLDWPNPLRARAQTGYTQGLGPDVLLSPFTQHEWSNPRGIERREGFTQWRDIDALTPEAAPFAQVDWALPIRPGPRQGFVHWAEISSIPLPPPFAQSEWPLPVTLEPRPVWDHKNLFGTVLYVEPATLPEGSQYDWPNPQLPRYTVTNYTITLNLIQTPLEAPDVEKIYSWLPIARRRRVR